MPTKVFSVKLTQGEVAQVERLVRTKKFDSISGVFRAGLGRLFDQQSILPAEEKQIELERNRHRPRANRKLMMPQPTPIKPRIAPKIRGRSPKKK